MSVMQHQIWLVLYLVLEQVMSIKILFMLLMLGLPRREGKREKYSMKGITE